MSLIANRFATFQNRWYALVAIALGLGIVIIDATILNVSIPYMLRDLNTPFSTIQWSISGYSLAIATVLITIGRVGDLWGRKKLFITGMVVFAAGSFIASVASSATIFIFARALIQGVGAAMVLTSALALLAATFQGKERAIAFGVWGAVAGASASLGPLLGGYLTTYYSWRWSLRINVFVALAAIALATFIIESLGEKARKFDWWGMLLSGFGIFSLVFGFIEGKQYGWWHPAEPFTIFGWQWPSDHLSVIPFFFAASVVFLTLFIWREYRLERQQRSPLLRLELFTKRGFSVGSGLLMTLSLGQFGTFLILPIYFENVLGYDALKTGVAFLSASISIFVFGILSGYLASRVNIKWIVVTGNIVLFGGILVLIPELSTTATVMSIAPGLILYGMGLGLSSSQLNNLIVSSAPPTVAGEASAASVMMRQIGSSIGVAIIGAFFVSAIAQSITTTVQADTTVPAQVQSGFLEHLGSLDIEAGQTGTMDQQLPPVVAASLKQDVDQGIVDASKHTITVTAYFVLAAALLSFFLPAFRAEPRAVARAQKPPSEPPAA